MRLNRHVLLFIGSIGLSILTHAFFLYQTVNGSYMAGPHDGLSQMIPFRKLIYDQFSKGNFFYSYHFGLGGGTYQLAYYYANNIFYFFVFGFVFLLEKLRVIGSPDTLFWANATLYISIVRLSLVFIITTYVFRYMKIRMPHAFMAAFLYGGSIMYFRHAAYWEFFSDAFLWLPLFLLGIEKIFREQKQRFLITAVALSMFDNFYFAYIHFLFMGIYILVRWLNPRTKDERKNVKQFAISILLGAGISSVSFVPAVYGFLHNFRPAYHDPIPFIDLRQNVLLGDKTIWLPVIFVPLLLISVLYKNHSFRVFAITGVLFATFHYVPFMASVFNGFSAPQYRFEYIISFCAAGAIAAGLQDLFEMTDRSLKKAFILALIIYCTAFVIHPTGLKLALLVVSIILLVLFYILIKKKNPAHIWGFLLVTNLIIVNVFQYGLYQYGGVKLSTKDYMTSRHYNSLEQRNLIHAAMQNEKSETTRLDWIIDDRNNTPIVEDYNGMSAYSSILNKNILFFYYKDLQIDMKRESVSRYNSLGDRANLYSLLRGKYLMYQKGMEKNIPFGFTPYMKSKNYIIYRNENILPFVRTTSKIYSAEYLRKLPMIDREHAMLDGVVLNIPTEKQLNALNRSKDLIKQTEMEPYQGTYHKGQLHVESTNGGLDIKLKKLPKDAKDLYLSFYLKNNSKTAPLFPLTVNEFETTRKSRTSIYRTTFDHLTVRIPSDQTIRIRMPKGSYTLKDFHLFSENYHFLKQAEKKKPDTSVQENKNQIKIRLKNTVGDSMMILPIPYEKGWEAKVNGRKQEVLKVNYAFIGVPIKPGENSIKLQFYPPFFRTALIISIVSFLISFWRVITRRRHLEK
ncbi:YfhO family protein [Falsibacillus pallidus]|uniref:YfhO family protein n=1 Tax=Falsibacillus pallidus TaxID=493781 RepID=UPI003D97FF65